MSRWLEIELFPHTQGHRFGTLWLWLCLEWSVLTEQPVCLWHLCTQFVRYYSGFSSEFCGAIIKCYLWYCENTKSADHTDPSIDRNHNLFNMSTRTPLQTVHESVTVDHRVSMYQYPIMYLLINKKIDQQNAEIIYFLFQPTATDDNANPRITSSRARSDEPHIGKYRLIKTIGKGNFAKVKLAKHVPTGREVNT